MVLIVYCRKLDNFYRIVDEYLNILKINSFNKLYNQINKSPLIINYITFYEMGPNLKYNLRR